MKSKKIIRFVQNEYSLKRQKAEDIAEKNYDFALQNENFKDVMLKISALNFDIAKKTSKGQDSSQELNQLKSLEKTKVAVLKKMKMSEKDFLPQYDCKLCNDTGKIGDNYCKCFEKRYYDVLHQFLNIEPTLNFNFSDVNFDVIKNKKQREYLAQLYDIMKKYADKFPNTKIKNILLSGGTGVGKSYLASAVSNRIKERGFNVIYVTATRLNQIMLNYHTAPAQSRAIYLSDILDCDLLIIDDLGSEQKINKVTDEYLLQIIDERTANNRPIFITTNLSEDALKYQYNERIFSRIANKKTTLVREIIGCDLRLN